MHPPSSLAARLATLLLASVAALIALHLYPILRRAGIVPSREVPPRRRPWWW